MLAQPMVYEAAGDAEFLWQFGQMVAVVEGAGTQFIVLQLPPA